MFSAPIHQVVTTACEYQHRIQIQACYVVRSISIVSEIQSSHPSNIYGRGSEFQEQLRIRDSGVDVTAPLALEARGAVASPVQKKCGGTKKFSFLVSSKSYNIHTWDTPRYKKKTFQRICANLKRGLNISGGPDPPIRPFPVATPLHG